MSFRGAFIGLFSALVLGAGLYMSGCGGSSDESSYVGAGTYSGPGSQWTVSLANNLTFTIERRPSVGAAIDMTVNGTYQQLTSGYLKLTVVSVSGSASDKPSPGDQAYALNIPGFAFLLKPMDADSEVIPMVISGDCPTNGFNLNWVITTHENSGNGTADFASGGSSDMLGIASYDGVNTLTIGNRYNISGSSVGAGSGMSGTCSNGILSVPATAEIWLTEIGGALVQTAAGGVIVAMPQDTISTASALDGEYTGLVFNENVSGSDKVQPVWATFNSAGTSEAGEWSNVDTGTKGATAVTFSAFNVDSPANGFVRMTLTDAGSSNTAPLACQSALNVNGTGKNMLFCVGVEADARNGGDNSQLYSVLLISK